LRHWPQRTRVSTGIRPKWNASHLLRPNSNDRGAAPQQSSRLVTSAASWTHVPNCSPASTNGPGRWGWGEGGSDRSGGPIGDLREVHRRGRGAARLKVGPLTGNKTAVYGLTVSTPGRLGRSPQPGDSGLFPQRGWAAPRQPPRGRWVRSDGGFVLVRNVLASWDT
jgi:hypothetical protein